jgi:hypothetical protein
MLVDFSLVLGAVFVAMARAIFSVVKDNNADETVCFKY